MRSVGGRKEGGREGKLLAGFHGSIFNGTCSLFRRPLRSVPAAASEHPLAGALPSLVYQRPPRLHAGFAVDAVLQKLPSDAVRASADAVRLHLVVVVAMQRDRPRRRVGRVAVLVLPGAGDAVAARRQHRHRHDERINV